MRDSRIGPPWLLRADYGLFLVGHGLFLFFSLAQRIKVKDDDWAVLPFIRGRLRLIQFRLDTDRFNLQVQQVVLELEFLFHKSSLEPS